MVRWLFLVATMGCVMAHAEQAQAQGRRAPGYLNRGSGLSPYLGLFNSNTGGTNGYFSYVRPMQQLNQVSRDTSRLNYSQQMYSQQQTAALERTVLDAMQQSMAPGTSGLQQRQTGMAGQRRPPAGFMNYSNYFQQTGPGMRSRQ